MNPLMLSVIAVAIVFHAVPTAAAEVESPRLALARAAARLWSQQGEDGGWHSGQYAVMRSGQALTPYVLHALLAVPEEIAPRPAEGVDRALDFIRRHVDEAGALGRTDADVLEYPAYSTSYAILCLLAVDDPGDEELLAKMTRWLAGAQFDEAEEFSPANFAYGGWGFDVAKGPGDPGHMDLAHTRRALAALAAAAEGPAGVRAELTSRYSARAEVFLGVVQRYNSPFLMMTRPQPALPAGEGVSASPFDGGFYFSPTVLAANKGRVGDDPAPHWRSYATATCDGILALIAAGVARDDERLAGAESWLREHSNLDYPQGIPTDYPEPWGDAVKFYHYSVRAEAYRALDWPETERRQLAELVAAQQRLDGAFRNEASSLMKEDDPLLCTALAVVALANSLAP